MDQHGYQQGFYEWSRIRPGLLEKIGLSDDIWEELSDSGDADEELQQRLAALVQKFEKLTYQDILRDFQQIFASAV